MAETRLEMIKEKIKSWKPKKELKKPIETKPKKK